MSDARFEDGVGGVGKNGADVPLLLAAQDGEGLSILSSLLQDAVFVITEMQYTKTRRRFAVLVNRFRWEDRAQAQHAKRGVERVQSLLVFHDVLAVQTTGIDRRDTDTVLSLLQIAFVPGPDGTGDVTLILSGDGSVALTLETLDVQLRDVTRPYFAPSGRVPDHGA